MKCENQTSENRREFIKLTSKFVREWNGHLEIVSLPQVIKILGHTCFSEQIFYRKQSLGAPDI